MSALRTLLAEASERSAAGDRAGSLRAYRAAIELAPGRADLWHNLGVLCTAEHAHGEALAAFDEAARLRPEWAEPWHARGHLLHAIADLEGARAAFDGALARDSAHLAARVNLALIFNKLKRYSSALAHLRKAREQAPTDERIWWLARNAFLVLRKDEEALADFLRFERYASPIVAAVPGLWTARRLGDAEREARALAATLSYPFADGYAQFVAEALGLLQYHDVDREALFALYRKYDAIVRAELAAAGDADPLAPAIARRSSGDDQRIRVGYLSADFRRHVMGDMLAPVLEAHDRQRFSIHLYALAPATN